MMAGRDGCGAAKRRRERQLRSFLRPREVEERELHVAPQRQKPPSPGLRPTGLVEPRRPQRREILQRTVEQFDAPVPQPVERLAGCPEAR